MRLGTTSYIYPADILTNVRSLADKVDDIEIVIFECDDRGTDLPDRQTVVELREIASAHGLTYTVHLPLDLHLPFQERGMETAVRVIKTFMDLRPHGFIIHWEGDEPAQPRQGSAWKQRTIACLNCLAAEAGSFDRLCVENMDGQSPEVLDTILSNSDVSCCVDVGHLWKDGLDPLHFLDAWLPRAKVVHLHGIGRRDHKGLSLMPSSELDPVVSRLRDCFDGVVTLEVFNEPDFRDCVEAFQASMNRLARRPDTP